jgi:hypothetical protein
MCVAALALKQAMPRGAFDMFFKPIKMEKKKKNRTLPFISHCNALEKTTPTFLPRHTAAYDNEQVIGPKPQSFSSSQLAKSVSPPLHVTTPWLKRSPYANEYNCEDVTAPRTPAVDDEHEHCICACTCKIWPGAMFATKPVGHGTSACDTIWLVGWLMIVATICVHPNRSPKGVEHVPVSVPESGIVQPAGGLVHCGSESVIVIVYGCTCPQLLTPVLQFSAPMACAYSMQPYVHCCEQQLNRLVVPPVLSW